jgi:LysR family glycine cleavage system transcriptional activator
MQRRIPLDAFQTFVTAARSETFLEAARRLNVTPSAVSHQMRSLERLLGTDLFERQGRSVRLSTAGASLLKSIAPALRTIEEAAEHLYDPDATRGPLAIACSAMFANRVFGHRLPEFLDAYPFIECSMISLDNDAVVAYEPADIGIIFGDGGWSGRWSMPLGAVRYSPVCSPRIAAQLKSTPADPANLLQYVVIHIDDGEDWRHWTAAAGIPPTRTPQRQLFTNDVSFALEIAANGGGVSLASDLMAETYLNSGALVRPFPVSIDVRGAWHVIVNQDKLHVPRVQLFVAWLARRLGLAPPQFVW